MGVKGELELEEYVYWLFLVGNDEILSTENSQCSELHLTEIINDFAECKAQLKCLKSSL